MAKKGKGSGGFNSQQAKSKWALLESAEDHALDQVVSGKANAGDFKRVSDVLDKMSSTAHQIFTEAVDAASALATDSTGNVEGPEFELALNKALAPQIEELLSNIKDIVEIESIEQIEEIEAFVGKSFEDLAGKLPPQDLPTVDDLLANNELINEDREAAATDSELLLDRIYARVVGVDTEVQKLIARLTEKDEEEDGFADRAKKLVEVDEDREEVLDELAEAATATTGAGTGAKSVIPGVETPEESEGQKLERQRQASLFDRLETFLDGQQNKALDSDAEKDKQEEEKADTWWKSFRKWVGGDDRKGRKSKSSLWDDIGTAAMLTAIFDPKFWDGLAKDIKKYVTWDNIKDAFFSSWKWLQDNTAGMVDWILQKLGIGGIHKNTNLTPAAQAQLDQQSAADQLAGMGPETQGAMIMAETKDGKLTEKGQMLYNAASPEAKKYIAEHKYDQETLGERGTRAWSDFKSLLHGDQTSRDIQQQEINLYGGNSTTVNGGRSSVAPSVVNPSSALSENETVVATASGSTTVSPSVALDDGETIESSPAQAPVNQGAQGAAPIMMHDFSFTQGTTDQLLLMNSSLLGH